MKHPYMGSEPLGLPLCMRSVDYSLLPVGAMAGRTLPGGRTYTQLAGANQLEETVQTSASTVARWPFVANLPRIGLLADGGIGLVLEPPRTNILLRSTEFDNAQWAKLGGSNVNANATTSPTGASDADTSTAGAGYWQQGQACSVSVPYTGSVYVRGDGAVSLGLRVTDTSDGAPTTNATFVLSTSYQRLAVTLQGDATMAQAGILIGQPVNFQGGHSYAIWQGQTEQGRYATNPIITAGTAASRAGFRVTTPLSRYVRGGVFRAVLTTVPHGAATEYDGDSATIRLWTIDANTYAEVNTTTRVLTVSVNGVARVAGVPLWWLRGHRVQWSWEVGGGNLRVRYRYSTDQGATWTLPFDPFGGTVYSDSAISTASSTIDLYSDSGSSKWWGTGVVSEEAIITAPAWALQFLPTADAAVQAHLRGEAAYVLAGSTVSSIGSQAATAGLGWAQAAGASQPSVATSGGKTYLSFDGSNDYLYGAAASSYAGASAKTVWIVTRIRSVTLNGAASYNNHMLVGDGGAGALWGAYTKVGPLAIGYNWDGTDDGVTASVGLAAWTWLRYRHDGSTVYLSVAGGAEVTVASGATSSMAGVLSVGGRASGAWAPIDVQDVIIANSATVGQQAAIDAYCAQRVA